MKKKFLDLTEKVDQMAGAGFYDIYTDTYEKISFRIKKVNYKKFVKIDFVFCELFLPLFILRYIYLTVFF